MPNHPKSFLKDSTLERLSIQNPYMSKQNQPLSTRIHAKSTRTKKKNNQNNAFHSKHILNKKNPMTNQQALCRIKSGTLASQIHPHQRQITHGQAQYMPNQNNITPKPPILYQIITIPSQIINIVAKSTPSAHLSIQCPSTSPTFQPNTYQHKPKDEQCGKIHA